MGPVNPTTGRHGTHPHVGWGRLRRGKRGPLFHAGPQGGARTRPPGSMEPRLTVPALVKPNKASSISGSP